MKCEGIVWDDLQSLSLTCHLSKCEINKYYNGHFIIRILYNID